MRFDYRGMGDSEGEPVSFDNIDDDIRSALDAFQAATHLEKFVLWGLCDGATAASFYAGSDDRIDGLVLVNPWVRSDASLAQAYMKRYYVSRLFEADFWSKIRRGDFSYRDAAVSLLQNFRLVSGATPSESREISEKTPLGVRLLTALERFNGRVLFVLSGNDMTAAEFDTSCLQSKNWRRLLGRRSLEIKRLPGANHTFSQADHRRLVEDMTMKWILNQ
jgi:exosortase A-associated hydrolase 1